MKHELKCWPQFFERTWIGDKNFEIRKADRDFREGDLLELVEWDPSAGSVTGRRIKAQIQGDVVQIGSVPGFHPFGNDFVVFSIRAFEFIQT